MQLALLLVLVAIAFEPVVGNVQEGQVNLVLLALSATSWLLIGPAHKLLQVLLVDGYSNVVVLRLLAEAGVLGVAALWIATLVAVRRSADGLDAAHEDGAEDHEHDRAREHDPVAP